MIRCQSDVATWYKCTSTKIPIWNRRSSTLRKKQTILKKTRIFNANIFDISIGEKNCYPLWKTFESIPARELLGVWITVRNASFYSECNVKLKSWWHHVQFQKISICTPRKVNGNSKWRGEGGVKLTNLLWEGYVYFLEQHIFQDKLINQ